MGNKKTEVAKQLEPWNDLTGKVMMVTGASAAIRRIDNLKSLCDEINDDGELRAVAVEVDVSSNGKIIEASITAMAWDAFGRIGALVNYAVKGNEPENVVAPINIRTTQHAKTRASLFTATTYQSSTSTKPVGSGPFRRKHTSLDNATGLNNSATASPGQFSRRPLSVACVTGQTNTITSTPPSTGSKRVSGRPILSDSVIGHNNSTSTQPTVCFRPVRRRRISLSNATGQH